MGKSWQRRMRNQTTIDGTLVSWLHEPCEETPVLYVHGVPDSAELWTPFLARTGGIAIDLPGFGRSGKPPGWPYSVEGYAAFLPAFLDHLGVDRVRLVCHDWGAVALTLGDRIERLVALNVVPLLPGHRWHRVARLWRTPVVGELGMGFTGRTLLRRVAGLSAGHADQVLRHFDHGTQRAILKLYRSSDTPVAALEAVTAPALVLWGENDRYLDPGWAERVAEALGGRPSPRPSPEPATGHGWKRKKSCTGWPSTSNCHPDDRERSPVRGISLNSSRTCAEAASRVARRDGLHFRAVTRPARIGSENSRPGTRGSLGRLGEVHAYRRIVDACLRLPTGAFVGHIGHQHR